MVAEGVGKSLSKRKNGSLGQFMRNSMERKKEGDNTRKYFFDKGKTLGSVSDSEDENYDTMMYDEENVNQIQNIQEVMEERTRKKRQLSYTITHNNEEEVSSPLFGLQPSKEDHTVALNKPK